MRLHQVRRSTQDMDFALIAGPSLPEPGKEFQVVVQRAEISKISSRVPDASKFRQAILIVAQQAGLDADWMNDESAVYLYDDAPQASVYFWRSFGVLHI